MSDGFADMSNMMNKFAVDNILPKSFAKSPLPVLYNSWEATGFDVDCENQLQIAEIAKKIGCELFVVDDGWFGARNNDCQGLGDWYVNNEKFPDGIDRLISGVNALGMDFGLWFEPEMVQENRIYTRLTPIGHIIMILAHRRNFATSVSSISLSPRLSSMFLNVWTKCLQSTISVT